MIPGHKHFALLIFILLTSVHCYHKCIEGESIKYNNNHYCLNGAPFDGCAVFRFKSGSTSLITDFKSGLPVISKNFGYDGEFISVDTFDYRSIRTASIYDSLEPVSRVVFVRTKEGDLSAYQILVVLDNAKIIDPSEYQLICEKLIHSIDKLDKFVIDKIIHNEIFFTVYLIKGELEPPLFNIHQKISEMKWPQINSEH